MWIYMAVFYEKFNIFSTLNFMWFTWRLKKITRSCETLFWRKISIFKFLYELEILLSSRLLFKRWTLLCYFSHSCTRIILRMSIWRRDEKRKEKKIFSDLVSFMYVVFLFIFFSYASFDDQKVSLFHKIA